MGINETIQRLNKTLPPLDKSHPDWSPEDRNFYLTVMEELLDGTRERRDLYTSLHQVGDDPVKANIMDDLKAFLDSDTYAAVEAIFHWNTDLYL